MEGTCNRVGNSNPGDQTITDIQRSVHSSKDLLNIKKSVNWFVYLSELKCKNGSIPQGSDQNCDIDEISGNETNEAAMSRGEVSWSHNCMSGITLCFKVE